MYIEPSFEEYLSQFMVYTKKLNPNFFNVSEYTLFGLQNTMLNLTNTHVFGLSRFRYKPF